MADITATIAATETNNDVAVIGGAVYNSANMARVSIEEIPATAGAASLIEEIEE